MSEESTGKVFIFGESDFLVEGYNPEQFIAKYSGECKLEDLKQDVAEFLKKCEASIMGIMNKDYESFISLALRLNGLKDKLQQLRPPLFDGQEQLQSYKDTLLSECESLTITLRKYQDVQMRKHHLQQFLEMNNMITQSEGLLKELQESPLALVDVFTLLKLERLCRSISRCEKMLSGYNYRDFSFLIMCQDRLFSVRKATTAFLRNVFNRNAQGSSYSKKLFIVLRCYVVLGMVEDITFYYRDNYVIPFIESIITREKLDGAERNSCSGLAVMLEAMSNYICNNCRAIILSSESILIRDANQKNHYVYDFLLSSIWTPIVEYIFRRIPMIFTCASHSIFQSNFSLCHAFVLKMASLSSNEAYFWAHQKTSDFCAKWEISEKHYANRILDAYLNVYITSLSLDFMTKQMSVLLRSSPSTEMIKETTSTIQKKPVYDFKLKATTTLYALLCQCYSPSVYIQQCSKDIMQLALALLARYFAYVRETLSSFSLPTKDMYLTSSSTATAVSPTTPVSPTPSSFDLCFPLLIEMIHDVLLLKSVMKADFFKTIASCIPTESQEEGVLKKAFTYFFDSEGEQLSQSLFDALLSIHLYNASISIVVARTVNSSYRMTNKPSPTTPSYYVSHILGYYESFEKKYGNSFQVDISRYDQWKSKFIEEVCVLYLSSVEDLLSQIARIEEVLMKHRKRNAVPGGMDGSDETDEDKMKKQLLLDVVSFKSCITGCGLQLSDSYQKLSAVVHEACSQKSKSG